MKIFFLFLHLKAMSNLFLELKKEHKSFRVTPSELSRETVPLDSGATY